MPSFYFPLILSRFCFAEEIDGGGGGPFPRRRPVRGGAGAQGACLHQSPTCADPGSRRARLRRWARSSWRSGHCGRGRWNRRGRPGPCAAACPVTLTCSAGRRSPPSVSPFSSQMLMLLRNWRINSLPAQPFLFL